MRNGSTEKQKKVAKILMEGEDNFGLAMRKAGYSETYSHNPQDLKKRVGFQEAVEAYGLTNELVVSSLVEDIKAKPQHRVEELRLGAKMLKLTGEDTPTGNTAIQINIGDDREKYA